MILLFITSIIAFIATLILTIMVKKIASKLKVYDRPNQRSIHQRSIPLLGGVAIFAAFLVSFSIIFIFSNNNLNHLLREIVVFLGGGFLILLLGIYDDIKGLGPKKKPLLLTIL